MRRKFNETLRCNVRVHERVSERVCALMNVLEKVCICLRERERERERERTHEFEKHQPKRNDGRR